MTSEPATSPRRSRRDLLERWVPIVRFLREAGPGSHRADILAGLTVAAMLVPQGMAYAALAGMPPVTGLYASVVPLVAYALLGTSGQLAVGPVAIVSLLTASTVAPLAEGDPASYVTLAAVLAGLVGAIQLLLGLLRAGRLTALLSHPVISGFTSAAAIVIATSQLDKLLGVDIGDAGSWIERATAIVRALGDVEPLTFAVGVVAIALLVAGRRLGNKVPTPLLVVVLATAAVPLLGLQERGVAVLGEVPGGFPLPTLPTAPLDAVVALLPGALIIALLSYLEGISVARAIAARTRDRIDADQELIASGTANLAASVVQAFPVAGGFSRTAVNHAAGARTPLASLVTAGGVLLALLLLAPLFTTLPQVVLAAVVLVAVTKLVDVREAVHAWRVERTDGLALTITFVATLLLGVEVGIGVGIAASFVLSLWRVGTPRIEVEPSGEDPAARTIHVEGDLLPASGLRLVDAVDAHLGDRDPGGRGSDDRDEVDRPTLELELSGVPTADLSGVQALAEVDELCRRSGVRLQLTGVRPGVLTPLHRAHLDERFGDRCRAWTPDPGPTAAPARTASDPGRTAPDPAHVPADHEHAAHT